MRIISGERRGHKLEGPRREARPTSDLVRESIFNILCEDVVDRPVFDVFAGTGALGLEALSRGASTAFFLERDRGNIEVIKHNISHLRYEDRTKVSGGDAYGWMKNGELDPTEPVVVFIDPPYRDYVKQPRRLAEALSVLVSRVPQGSILVVEGPEHGGSECLPPELAWDLRHYGGTIIAVGRLAEPANLEEQPPL